MITLNTVLYRVDRDKRYGNINTHPFIEYILHTITINNSFYIYIFKKKDRFGNDIELYTIFKNIKQDKEELIIDDKKDVIFISSKTNSVENIQKILKNSSIKLTKEETREDLITLINNEVEYLKSKINKDKEHLISLNKDLKQLIPF